MKFAGKRNTLLDELTAGGDSGEAILIVLLIAVIVILVLYIIGYRIVLKK